MNQIKIKRFMYHFVLVGLASFMCYFFVWGEFGLANHYSLQKEFLLRQNELTILKRDIRKIQRELHNWKNDRFYLEKMAREEFGMGYKGEILYLVSEFN